MSKVNPSRLNVPSLPPEVAACSHTDDVVAERGQAGGHREAAHAGTDHHDPRHRHGPYER